MKEHTRLCTKVITFIFILLLPLTLTACSNKESDIGKGDIGTFFVADAYIAESCNIGNVAYVSAATVSTDDIIYFFGSEHVPGDGDTWYALYYFDTNMTLRARKIPYELESNATVSSISLNQEGYLDFAVVIDPFDERAKPDLSIRRIDLDGTEISRLNISGDYFDDEYIYPQDLIIDSYGRIHMINSSTIYTFDSKGSLKNKILTNGYWLRLSQDFLRENIYVTYNSDSGAQIARVNTESGPLGQSHNLAGFNNSYGLAANISNHLLIASDIGISVYEPINHQLNEVFTWNSLNMSASMSEGMSRMFLALSEGRFGLMENKSGKVDFRIIRALTEDDIVMEKTTLILGGFFELDNDLKQAIVEFNQNNPHYRIESKNYGISHIDEDLNRFNMDIFTGNVPDIILLPRSPLLEIYNSRGIIADLYPYIDGDSDFKRTDFYENILKAYEVNGQLLAMPLYFQLRTLIAPMSEVGDINGWTLDEMINYVDSLPPGTRAFMDNNKSAVLSLCLYANDDALVDWSANGSGFKRDLVIKMLNFANRYEADEGYEHDLAYVRRIQEDKQMKFMETLMADHRQLMRFPAFFGEPVAYPGFPSENGNGNIIIGQGLLAISKASEHREGAWEFIRYMLEDYQNQNYYMRIGIPILKSAYEYKKGEIERYLISNGKNADETLIEDLDNYRGSENFGNTYEIHPLTGNEIKAMQNLINSADKIRRHDVQVFNIVYEEAQLFFAGVKSVEEVVDIMESRIWLYVAEMK